MRDRIVRVQLLEHRATPRTTWHVLRVECADGVSGLGECSDVPDVDELARAVDTVRHDLIGRQAEAGAEVLADLLAQRDRAADPRAAFRWSTLAGAVDCALLDLRARRHAVPVATLLTGSDAVGHRIRLYANLNREHHDRTPADFARAAKEARDAGFGAVKLAPFDGPHAGDVTDGGLEIVQAVRDAVNDDVAVLVDVHHHLDEAELDRAIPRLEALDVGWLEDAVDVLDTDALVRLARRTRIPLAGGEHLFRAADVERACRTAALKYLLIDPKHAGGPGELRALLATAGATVVTFHNPSGPVGTALSAHLAPLLTEPLVEYATGQAAHRQTATRAADEPIGGMLTIGAEPGLGVTLDDGAWTPR